MQQHNHEMELAVKDEKDARERAEERFYDEQVRELLAGRRKQALLGDAIEAIIAAVYLDGGFDEAKALILRLWGDRVMQVKQDARDAKTANVNVPIAAALDS